MAPHEDGTARHEDATAGHGDATARHGSVSLDSRVPCRGIKDCQFSVDAFKRRGYRCESAAEIGRDRAQRKKPSKGGVSEPKPPHIAVNSDPRRREDVESSVPRAVAVLATWKVGHCWAVERRSGTGRSLVGGRRTQHPSGKLGNRWSFFFEPVFPVEVRRPLWVRQIAPAVPCGCARSPPP